MKAWLRVCRLPLGLLGITKIRLVPMLCTWPVISRLAPLPSAISATTDATPMTIVEGALWSVMVPLTPGEYPFMYVIDGGQWITPPHAEDFVTDGFGQTNGVVIVR